MRLRFLLSVLGAGLIAGAYGCTGRANLDEHKPCSADADCSPTQTCSVIGSPGERPAMVAPNPCLSQQPCASSAECGTGAACIPTTQLGYSPIDGCPAMVCGAPCTATSCRADEVCRENGVCDLARCDEAGAPACAAHWRCDPGASVLESPSAIRGATETDEPVRAVQRGCVRVPCDEAGGFACLVDWECDPARSLEGTGCAAIPCEELGHCSVDTIYICAPTSSGPRPAAEDVFGCVPRNCEEGRECNYVYQGKNLGYCNPSAEAVDAYGCSVHSCTEEPTACVSGSYRCEPDATGADRVGCVPVGCDEGYVCQEGWTCAPDQAGTNVFGCRPDALGGTGGAGSGGTSGNAGAGGSAAVGGNLQGGTSGGGGAALGGSGRGSGSAGRGGSGATGGGAGGGGTGVSGSGVAGNTSSRGTCVTR